MPIHPSTVTIDNWKGLNNVLGPEGTPQDFLKEAFNIDIDKAGGIRKRLGYELKMSGDFHSLWSEDDVCLMVKDSDLIRIDGGFNTLLIKSGVGTDKISFDTDGINIYYSSISVSGVVDKGSNLTRSWGLERPNPLPIISTSPGLLQAGTYFIALTYIDSFGRESGTGVSQSIDLLNNRSILLSNLPTPVNPDIVGINIYASTQNGSQLYLNKTIPVGLSSTSIDDVSFSVLPLRTVGVNPAPKGHIVKYAHSRLWVADDSILWFSDPLTYDWFRYNESYFQFESRIKAVMPTQDGMWVATNKLYYLAGKDPEKITRTEKEPVKVIEGSEVKIVGSYLFIDNTPIGFKWLVTTDQGVFALYNDGIAINLTSRNVNYPRADFGTGMFVRTGGINRYTTILQKKGSTNSTTVGDQVTAKVIRNGIIVQE